MTSPAAEHGAGPAPPALAAAPPSAVGLHGAISAFNPAQEEWDEYIERLQHYFTANDILAEDKRRAILLTAVGPSTYRLIRTLVAPAKVTEVSFDDIVAKAKAHFCPKPSPIVKRFEFNTRRQGEGWPEQNPASDADQELSSYFRRRWELGVEGGCMLWGCRVVVPVKGRQRAMEMLHEAHPGVARMKSLARSYLWWPGMDKQIERCVRECSTCQVSRKEPPVVPLQPWPWPDKPWTRIHIDYAGPMEGRMFLIVTDAHSKWVDIHATTSSTSNVTIEMLRKSFATLGLPEVVVSDNATAFTSSEFAEFLKRNGIRHIHTPPYHPASNGLVERMVQTFKEGMKRLKQGSLNTRLARFLFKYRLTPHSSTGVSPAELMFGRKLRSQFDLIKPSIARTVRRAQEQQAKEP